VAWLNLVVTSRAKTKIRAFLRQEERTRGRELGREILEREFKKHGLNLNKLIKDDAFHQPLQNLRVRNMDELCINVAYGKIPVDKILLEFIPREKLELKPAVVVTWSARLVENAESGWGDRSLILRWKLPPPVHVRLL